MTDSTIQTYFTQKRQQLETDCLYGLTHFCDGTTNMSAEGIENGVKPKDICPRYFNCDIRKHSIYEERKPVPLEKLEDYE